MLKTFAVTALAIGLVITLGLIGVVQPASALTTAASATDYPRLATVLFQLSQASNPARFAGALNLEYAEGRVHVIVELQNVEAIRNTNPEITAESESGAWITSWVPVSKLLQLAQDSNVLLILPIYKPS